ncbi:MAG: hypothetical protein Q4B79_03310 [Moraxella sp.]|uniref:hypothetical protein n=1 Tax=Moraxella sp. TaxID=479 RepID=UPI0026DD22AA|nr:hypothetical protein [Moraxella sp.]MDO4449972.1 hypothetical protein [Moraxella sp.]
MDIVANYYAINNKQITYYQQLANQGKKDLLQVLNNLPNDDNFVSIGELWEGLHYILSGYGADSVYTTNLPQDDKTAIYCAFFGGEWAIQANITNHDKEHFWGAELTKNIIENSEQYFWSINSDDFLFLSVIKYTNNTPTNLLEKINQSLDTKDIKKSLEKYPTFETLAKMARSGHYLYTSYWHDVNYQILSEHLKNAFIRLKKFYKNALNNNLSVLVVITRNFDEKSSIDNCTITKMI